MCFVFWGFHSWCSIKPKKLIPSSTLWFVVDEDLKYREIMFLRWGFILIWGFARSISPAPAPGSVSFRGTDIARHLLGAGFRSTGLFKVTSVISVRGFWSELCWQSVHDSPKYIRSQSNKVLAILSVFLLTSISLFFSVTSRVAPCLSVARLQIVGYFHFSASLLPPPHFSCTQLPCPAG